MKKYAFRTFLLFADVFILFISFFIMVWIKPSSIKSYIASHYSFFISLAVIWIIVSFLNGKLNKKEVVNYSILAKKVFTSNIISIGIAALLMYSFRDYHFSRTVVLGTIIMATAMELILGSLFLAYKKANIQDYEEYEEYKEYITPSEYDLVKETAGNGKTHDEPVNIHPNIIKALKNECGQEQTETIIRMTGAKLAGQTAILSTTSIFNLNGLIYDNYNYIINLHKINDIKRLDDFLDAVNEKLSNKGYFLCCVETKDQRKKRILKKFPIGLNYIYYLLDFVIKRILPKLKLTRNLYMLITRGENAVISRAEALGRLSRAGFKIKQESFIGNLLFIETQKYYAPLTVNENIYGPLIALPRIGKGGEMFKVYKMRTMHPYSEYIQDYIYMLHNLQGGGKFKHDFRITSWGAFCRKIWLDELPMLINFFKGDVKLVGVRPLSKQYLSLYKHDIQERRIKYKPGLVPPFYADMPADIEAIQASELKYLDAYDKHPFKTDFKYFFKSMWNIVAHNARSK